MSQKPVFKTRTQLVEEAIRTQILKGELKLVNLYVKMR